MNFFYKYRCRKCGKRYFNLPTACDNCGIELSFVCPISVYADMIFKKSKHCEEIHEFIISFYKSKKTRRFEEKINGLNVVLSDQHEENEKLIKEKIECIEKIRTLIDETIMLNRRNIELSSEIASLKITLSNKKIDERFSENIPIHSEIIQAVKYAMKHAHPDNGGNKEDFIKFQKCYKELIRRQYFE